MKVVTVLKSGGDYNEGHVEKLHSMVKKYVPHDEFICLSDMQPNCNVIPLKHDFKGWWAKIEMFRISGEVLYFDLDTIIVGDMTDILKKVEGRGFVILRDVYRGKADKKSMQSSVMFWSKDMSFVYEQFVKNPEYLYGGDQEYIEKMVKDADYWQDITEGIVSFKVEIARRGLHPADKCVFFHGHPRPWEQSNVSYN